ncbi:type II toxin-antitoxin system VapC family toxin [Brachybacterium atlanticum]|uniref:type II toxin-antitoxin system VapC family toxin n=1 Tax=Brachybacterium atlanticum TaxID=2911888 RepID=UPI0021E09C68|nr:type II toxin-antitoxin system VapC family toxin [Brachybacterium atlanticum]
MIVYLDTSAMLKILIDEPGMQAMREAFTGWQLAGDELVSSFLLHTEMHCAASRRGVAAPETIDLLLGAVGLIDIDRADLLAAARGSHRLRSADAIHLATALAGLRSADAIHLATALAVDADVLVTFDAELADAAAGEGLRALSPA